MKKGSKIFWGVFFVLAAALVIASQFGVFGVLGFWSILAMVLLVAVFIASLVKLNFFGVLLSAALLYMIVQTPLGLYDISPWMLLGAVVLGSIGLSLLFHKRKPHSAPGKGGAQVTSGEHMESYGGYHPEMQREENSDDNHPYARVRFGATSRYLHADALENGQFYAAFGSLEVFFDQATLAPGGAEIYLDCSFGAIKLYVPKGWRVEDRVDTLLGGVSNDMRFARPDETAPALVLTGRVQFGGIEIGYV